MKSDTCALQDVRAFLPALAVSCGRRSRAAMFVVTDANRAVTRGAIAALARRRLPVVLLCRSHTRAERCATVLGPRVFAALRRPPRLFPCAGGSVALRARRWPRV
jgi:cation transport ATPase